MKISTMALAIIAVSSTSFTIQAADIKTADYVGKTVGELCVDLTEQEGGKLVSAHATHTRANGVCTVERGFLKKTSVRNIIQYDDW